MVFEPIKKVVKLAEKWPKTPTFDASRCESANIKNMVFKRPANSRDDRNGRSGKPSKGADNKRSSSSRANSSRSTDRPNNDNSKKRYSSGPAAERNSFSTGAEKKS